MNRILDRVDVQGTVWGQLGNELFYRDSVPSPEIAEVGRARSFDGDGHLLWVVSKQPPYVEMSAFGDARTLLAKAGRLPE